MPKGQSLYARFSQCEILKGEACVFFWVKEADQSNHYIVIAGEKNVWEDIWENKGTAMGEWVAERTTYSYPTLNTDHPIYTFNTELGPYSKVKIGFASQPGAAPNRAHALDPVRSGI